MENSLEKGVYLFCRKAVIERGDIVKFITSPKASKLALEREYITARKFKEGIPIDTAKIVEGIPGDSYTINSKGVFINGDLVSCSAQMTEDSIGRPMPTLEIEGVLKENQYIVMSQEHVKGYDSRYYGYITREMISGVGKKVL